MMGTALLAILGALLGTVGGRELLAFNRSRRWPETLASIADLTVGSSGPAVTGNVPSISSGRVHYEYEIDGRRYVGQFGPYKPVLTPADNWQMLHQFPVGRSITIRYNPSNPSQNYFDRDSEGLAILCFVIGITLIGLAIVSAVV